MRSREDRKQKEVRGNNLCRAGKEEEDQDEEEEESEEKVNEGEKGKEESEKLSKEKVVTLWTKQFHWLAQYSISVEMRKRVRMGNLREFSFLPKHLRNGRRDKTKTSICHFTKV